MHTHNSIKGSMWASTIWERWHGYGFVCLLYLLVCLFSLCLETTWNHSLTTSEQLLTTSEQLLRTGPLVPTVAFFFDFASAVSTAAVAQWCTWQRPPTIPTAPCSVRGLHPRPRSTIVQLARGRGGSRETHQFSWPDPGIVPQANKHRRDLVLLNHPLHTEYSGGIAAPRTLPIMSVSWYRSAFFHEGSFGTQH